MDYVGKVWVEGVNELDLMEIGLPPHLSLPVPIEITGRGLFFSVYNAIRWTINILSIA
ncbi:MAG TPA: hypothetical protein VLZ33_01220 [Dysgonamonadaceae bacterium]|nr:hypothetical protein [Dysgonamonadaceae bacterium]